MYTYWRCRIFPFYIGVQRTNHDIRLVVPTDIDDEFTIACINFAPFLISNMSPPRGQAMHNVRYAKSLSNFAQF